MYGASASPTSKSSEKKLVTSPSFNVHGGQHASKSVTFDLLLYEAFVADEMFG